MNPKSTQDPFDLDFDADDEFSSPVVTDTWDDAASAPAEAADPFAPTLEEPLEDAPIAAAVAEPARPAANPVHEMLAGAEAAFGETLLPRITVHIFCATPETAELADRAAEDRRMERTTVVTRMGGLAAAVEVYQNQATPSLVMVECLESAPELLGLLDRLAQVCDPGTKVVLIGSANDIALYRELMRRGVSEYLVPPLNPLQMVRTVAGLYADPSAPFVGRQIAFCGAKGGAGTSTIAHNVAYSITERLQTGAVLVDLDLAFGTAGLDFNQDPIQGIVDALQQPDRLDPVLMDRMMARCTERLSLFAAPATLDADYEIGGEAYEE
ncbi:CpaE family protein, partial [Phenylobacterium sp.]|uniref:AAA family ATPase n=1 Tax=Phenylobacterium sp. TaxID=1871053 RepID=UPI0038621D46